MANFLFASKQKKETGQDKTRPEKKYTVMTKGIGLYLIQMRQILTNGNCFTFL